MLNEFVGASLVVEPCKGKPGHNVINLIPDGFLFLAIGCIWHVIWLCPFYTLGVPPGEYVWTAEWGRFVIFFQDAELQGIITGWDLLTCSSQGSIQEAKLRDTKHRTFCPKCLTRLTPLTVNITMKYIIRIVGIIVIIILNCHIKPLEVESKCSSLWLKGGNRMDPQLHPCTANIDVMSRLS